MKILTIILIATLLFVISFNVSAQIEVKRIDDLLLEIRLNKISEGLDGNYQDIEGGRFMFKDFQKGSVKLKDGSVYLGMLRYDKYTDEIQFKKEDDIYAVAFPDKIEYIIIDTLAFIYSDYKLSASKSNTNEGAYFEVVIDGKCRLLKRNKVKLKEAKLSNGISASKPAEFIDKRDSYFIKMGDQPAFFIKNTKSLLSILDDKKVQITSLIKKEKLSVKKGVDLKKIMDYYNSL